MRSTLASSEMSSTPNSGGTGAGQLAVEFEATHFHDPHDSPETTTSTGIYAALNPLSMSVMLFSMQSQDLRHMEQYYLNKV